MTEDEVETRFRAKKKQMDQDNEELKLLEKSTSIEEKLLKMKEELEGASKKIKDDAVLSE